jgi:nucleotide-binding universal stress UspA family protein
LTDHATCSSVAFADFTGPRFDLSQIVRISEFETDQRPTNHPQRYLNLKFGGYLVSYQSITTVLHSPTESLSALEYAIEVARFFDAHLHVVSAGIDSTDPGFYYAGAHAIAVQQNLENAQHDANEIEKLVTSRLEREDVKWDVQSITMMVNGVRPFLEEHMRFYDLAVMPLPYGDQRTQIDTTVFEACIFDADIPVLVVPETANWHHPPKRVLIAWDSGSEALAASRAAIPFAKNATTSEICMIAPPRTGPDRSDPGGKLAQLLARSGAKVEITISARTCDSIAEQLLQRAIETDVDLIAMGAYGHSRLREAVMGGVTRTMLRKATQPVLMAH